MAVGVRVVFVVMAAVPLLAPYELLVRVDWQDRWGPLFVIAALVSAGAVAVSALFLVAAVAGTSSRIVVDRRSATIASSVQAPGWCPDELARDLRRALRRVQAESAPQTILEGVGGASPGPTDVPP